MGSQSFHSDPSPSFHPLWRQTACDCPWLLLLRRRHPTLPVWPRAEKSSASGPELKLPSATPGLTTGASSARRSPYESTPPSGRLVSDPLLRTGRNGFILLPLVQKPDSDKQQGAGGGWHWSGVGASWWKGSRHLQFHFHRLHFVERLVVLGLQGGMSASCLIITRCFNN